MNSIIEAQEELENCRIEFLDISDKLKFLNKDYPYFASVDYNPSETVWVEDFFIGFDHAIKEGDKQAITVFNIKGEIIKTIIKN